MTLDVTRDKSEIINENIELQKEVKKLHEMMDGLVKTQIKILQNAIRGDRETVANNETIQNGKKMAELNKTVEKSVQEVEAKLAAETTQTIAKVTNTAKTVGEVASKVYNQAVSATKGTSQVVEMGKEAANVSNQMAIGMQQVSTASQQVSSGCAETSGFITERSQKFRATKESNG